MLWQVRQDCTVLYCTVLYCTVLYILYILYCNVLYLVGQNESTAVLLSSSMVARSTKVPSEFLNSVIGLYTQTLRVHTCQLIKFELTMYNKNSICRRTAISIADASIFCTTLRGDSSSLSRLLWIHPTAFIETIVDALILKWGQIKILKHYQSICNPFLRSIYNTDQKHICTVITQYFYSDGLAVPRNY